MTYNLRAVDDGDRINLWRNLQATGASAEGCAYMLKKALHFALLAEGVSLSAALIIKEEALSHGAEAAIGRGAILGEKGPYNVLILATEHQFELMAERLAAQPFGLKALAQDLREIIANISRDSWRIPYANGCLELGQKTLIMGILNLTPDSFYDGGKYAGPDEAVRAAQQMVADGADIIDIGGASSRPGFSPVSAAEELQRVLPVIERLAQELAVPISIDSDKAAVVAEALQAGAAIINDIGGLQSDPEMASVAAKSGAPLIVMHQGGDEADLFGEMTAFFRRSLAIAAANGVEQEKIILDPGIGFAKTTAQDLAIIRLLPQLKTLGRPLLIGASNKKFIGYTLDAGLKERREGTAATVAIAIAKGAAIVRVHDVLTIKKAAAMSDAIMGR